MENSTKILVGIGALAGAYFILKHKNGKSTVVSAGAGTTTTTVKPSPVSADWNPSIYYTNLPVQDPFYNAHPVLHDSSSVITDTPALVTGVASGIAGCMTITFNATQGGGYAKWLDCQGYPREQYLASTKTLTVCAMNGTPSGIPYSVVGQC